MAVYSMTFTGVTHTAVADTTNMTDSGYAGFLQGGNSTQRLKISEIYLGGEDTSGNPTQFVLARDSTVAATGITGNRLAALDGSATAPGTLPTYGNVSTTKPQRSSTLHLLHKAFNTFGGAIRHVCAPGNEITVVGNTASLGEVSLSSLSGTGKVSGEIIFEVV